MDTGIGAMKAGLESRGLTENAAIAGKLRDCMDFYYELEEGKD